MVMQIKLIVVVIVVVVVVVVVVTEVFSEKTQHTLKMADVNEHTLFQ